MAATKLILVRHGETVVNAGGKMHQDKDLAELTKKGKLQIEKTAKKLKSLGINKLYSSMEKRATQSANIIGEVLELENEKIIGLEERQWGKLAGKAWGDISKILDKLTLEERYTYIPNGGESWKQFIERFSGVIEKIIKDNEGETVVIVTHGGAIRDLIPYLLNEPKETSFKYDPPNSSITSFKYESGKFKRELLMSTSHLEEK